MSGTDDDGAVIKFTKAERLLLAKFSEKPGTMLSRERLLDAVSGAGSDAFDRNVDFVINRLRRKLRDAARSPTYIETRYGEGYVWIAERIELSAKSSGAFLVIGPIRGLKYVGRFADQARSYAEQLRSLLSHRFARENRVVVDEDCPSAEDFTGDKPAFAAELNFLDSGGRLDCAATVKAFGAGQIIRVLRHTVAEGEAGGQLLDRKGIEANANEIAEAIWDMLAYPASHLAPSEDVLAVRMYAASEMFAGVEPWLEADARLRAALEKNSDDFQARLMLATNLHSKYLTAGMILPEVDNRAADEDEMEALVLSSLPHLQDNPVFVMAAAKLLYFLDRGHRPLAVEIAEKAFNTTTAFAMSFAIFGQMRMAEGEIEEALALFDRGLELVPDGSHFDRYLLTLKCQALLASGDWSGLTAAFNTLCQRKSGIQAALSVFFTPYESGEIIPEAQFLADSVDERRARAMLLWLHYICARLFRSAEHGANIMTPASQLFVHRFGLGIVPAEVGSSFPTLIAAQASRTAGTSTVPGTSSSSKATVTLDEA
ncbi:MAG: winged helix-turn-helix domain-containing protein [Rhizobiaceae bacterium]|nr:winged helix-turn-helix domain-containing protein [Rhizobiaceae bacterium]